MNNIERVRERLFNIADALIAGGNLSVGLKVFSTTAPEMTFLSFVRTKAAPLPGFTCWNSITCITFPSISNVIPFLKSPAITIFVYLRMISEYLKIFFTLYCTLKI